MLLYIAGKVSENSQFGTHNWRDGFVQELEKLSQIELSHLDPLQDDGEVAYDPQFVFDKDCWLISRVDCVVAYLSDDISVGGSQEMLIAKYLHKPLIGYAPSGGKFNTTERVFLGQTIKNYIDPFVYATCDSVCGTLEQVSQALKQLPSDPKGIGIIDQGVQHMVDRYG